MQKHGAHTGLKQRKSNAKIKRKMDHLPNDPNSLSTPLKYASAFQSSHVPLNICLSDLLLLASNTWLVHLRGRGRLCNVSRARPNDDIHVGLLKCPKRTIASKCPLSTVVEQADDLSTKRQRYVCYFWAPEVAAVIVSY